MIIDVRQIVFSQEALMEGVRLFREIAGGDRFPPGNLQRCLVVAGNEVAMVAEVAPLGGSRLRAVELNSSEIAAMLILVCRKYKIPLPRSAKKDLQARGDTQVVLTITTRVGIGPPGG